MATQDKKYSVVRAFSSYAADGSGEQRYFTAGNQHELKDFISAEELQYRIDAGFVGEEDLTPPVLDLTFHRPVDETVVSKAGTPMSATRAAGVAPLSISEA